MCLTLVIYQESGTKHISHENSNLSQPTDTQFYRRQKNSDLSSINQHLRMFCFYENIRSNNFLGHNILTDGVLVWAQHFDRRCVCNQTS